MGTGCCCKTFIVFYAASWFAVSSTGCSRVVQMEATAGKGESKGDAEQNLASRAAKGKSKSDPLDSPQVENPGGGASGSKSQKSATESNNGEAATSGGKSPENGPGKPPTGLSSIAEGLFGKPSGSKGKMSPTEAQSKAASLEREAIDLEKKGRREEAFERALEAWQLVRVHDQDSACCGLTQHLEPILERLGEAANTRKVRATGKPLQVQ